MNLSGVSLFAAFFGGIASFASPCVLPLVPAYLAIVGGLDLGVEKTRKLGAMTRDTLLFIGGFSVVFVLLGLSASAVGRAVVHQQTALTRASGVVIVLMALFMLGTEVLRQPGLAREYRVHPTLSRFGPFAAPVAGAAFAFGWTPCVGPILAAVLALSTQQGHLLSAGILLVIYSAGLGVPFLMVSLFFDHLKRPMGWLKRHGAGVTVSSALVLGTLGILLLMDRLAWLTTMAQRL